MVLILRYLIENHSAVVTVFLNNLACFIYFTHRFGTYIHFGGGAKTTCFPACTLHHGTMERSLMKKRISFPTRFRLLSAFPAYGRFELSQVSTPRGRVARENKRGRKECQKRRDKNDREAIVVCCVVCFLPPDESKTNSSNLRSLNIH